MEKIYSNIQQVFGTISIVTNSFLAYLILTKSPQKLGTYKWLMLYTCFFELIYASLTFFVTPTQRNHESVNIVFQDMDGIWFNHQTAQIFLLIYLTCFGSSMALFAVHFIYRYGAVNKDFQKSYLSGAKLAILYFCPVISGVFWGITCWVFMSESSETSNFMRPGPDGKVHPDIFSFIGVGILYLILSFSLFCVLYFGINCYLWISRKLGSLENQSQATKSLQTQLFYALLIQALIPFVLMYLPATIVFTFPMLNLDSDIKYPFMEITIALYPAIDPFPTILIIKHYRVAVIRILKCNRTNQISGDYSHGTSAVPKNMSNAVI